jgi:S-layer protein (TIGR01567 family)
MDEGSGFTVVPIFVIVFLACAGQAAAPVSDPESRFVWEPGENLTFTWTNENFDGFCYDAQSRAGNESLTIKLDNIKDRSIPKNGITYSKTPGQTNTHYRLSGKYAVLELRNEKYLAEYPEDRSDIKSSDGRNPIRLHQILIDENASHKVENRSHLPLSYGYDIEVRSVNLSDASVLLSLKRDGVDVDTRNLDVGENFIYEANDGQIIAVHVDSVIAGGEENSVLLDGIFQTSERFTKNMNGNIFGMMIITDVSDSGIMMKNTAGIIELKPGKIIDIGIVRLKVADSDTLRFQLYCDTGMANKENKGAVHTYLNRLMAWDGLNYAGFMYDINSGNNSESLEINNITGRTIPMGGLIYASYMDRLTYTNYMSSVPYAVTKINDKKSPGNWPFVAFSLGGNKYIVKSKIPRMLTVHGVAYYDKKWLGIGPFEFNGETWELGEGSVENPLPTIWELGEGYTLRATSVNFLEDPRKIRLVLKRNGVDIEDVWLKQ